VSFTGNSLGSVKREPTYKDGKPAKELLLTRGKEIVTPGDRVTNGLLPVGHISAAAGQQRQPMLEPVCQNLCGQEPGPGRSQFNCQRQSIQPAADLGNGANIVVCESEGGVDFLGSRDEQMDCRDIEGVLQIRRIAR